jgi:hypothetical protein
MPRILPNCQYQLCVPLCGIYTGCLSEGASHSYTRHRIVLTSLICSRRPDAHVLWITEKISFLIVSFGTFSPGVKNQRRDIVFCIAERAVNFQVNTGLCKRNEIQPTSSLKELVHDLPGYQHDPKTVTSRSSYRPARIVMHSDGVESISESKTQNF